VIVQLTTLWELEKECVKLGGLVAERVDCGAGARVRGQCGLGKSSDAAVASVLIREAVIL
jgi:serine acetyltransferase